MYISSDFLKDLTIIRCDDDKKEYQLKAEDFLNKMIGFASTAGLNILYNRFGEDYKTIIHYPLFIWSLRQNENDLHSEKFNKKFPDEESVYEEMRNNLGLPWTEEEINNIKNQPNSLRNQLKEGNHILFTEGDAYVDGKKTRDYNFEDWLFDNTVEAPLEAVTYWKNHTVTNSWILFHDNSKDGGDLHEDKTEEEIKEIISTLSKEFIGDVLKSAHAIPVDYDEKGGQKILKSLEEGTDEDTYEITDVEGKQYILDGKEKAIEKATEIANEKVKVQFGLQVLRKITEPDGYFAWREENRADYL